MATAQGAISGSIRFSSTSNLVQKTFAASIPLSAFATGEIVLSAGISDFVLSIDTMSSPSVIFLTATSTIRVNTGGMGHASNASAGQPFSEFWGYMGSYISGPLSLRFANSTASAQNITFLIGRSG